MTLGRRNFFRTAGAGLAFMGVSGLLEACARPVAAPTTTAPGSPAAVKLGILTDLTGPYAAVGKSLLNNVQLAQDELGSGESSKFELIVEDMATDPKTSVEKATKLVQSDKVAAVIGVISSAAREAVRPVVADRGKLPFIYTTGYEGGDCNTNLWCAGPVPPQEVNPTWIG